MLFVKKSHLALLVSFLIILISTLANFTPAQAATVSTSTIDCSTYSSGTSNIDVSSALNSGDTLTFNYTKCNGFSLTWSGFTAGWTSGGSTATSPFSESGNNTEARSLTNYTGTLTTGTVLATLSKTTGGSTTTIQIKQIAGGVDASSATWTAKSPGVVGTSYSYTFNTSAGSGDVTLKSGTLPSGLTLGTNGVLSGTPTKLGTYTFTIQRSGVTSDTGSLSVAVTAPVVTKVTICHRTRATTNPYRLITVSVNSITSSSGHSEHNTTRTNKVNPQDNSSSGSGVFNGSYSYTSSRKWWGDIIPPFTHSGGNYEGLNWDSGANTPDPSASTANWLQPAEFATAANVAGALASWKTAVGYCMNLSSSGAETTQSAAVNTVDKFFKVSIENGEDADDTRSDLAEQMEL